MRLYEGHRVHTPVVPESRVRVRGTCRNTGRTAQVERRAQVAVEYVRKHPGARFHEIQDAIGSAYKNSHTLLLAMEAIEPCVFEDDHFHLYVGWDQWERLR